MTSELSPHEAVLARFLVYSEAGLRRVSFDVAGEQVSVQLRHGRLRTLCTCGSETCEHQQVALSFLGAEAGGPAGGEVRVRSSMRPPPGASGDWEPLAAAFDALILATARAGVDAPDSPSIREALEQVVARAPVPPTLTFARWVGRFNEALAAGEVGKVARLLDGAQRVFDELRAGDRTPAALARRRSWLGGLDAEGSETLADTALVEIAREWLNGTSRASLERRYLLDLVSGEVFGEDRRRGEQDASVGPCPRVAHVSFGELDVAVRPRRLRLLQYTVSPEPTQDQWARSSELADQRVDDLARRYADAARSAPGVAEPFVLFAPASLESGAEAALIDGGGGRLPLGDGADAPLADAVRAVSQDGELIWISGRLLGLTRGLVLRPTSVLLRERGKFVLRRVT